MELQFKSYGKNPGNVVCSFSLLRFQQEVHAWLAPLRMKLRTQRESKAESKAWQQE